MRRGARARGHTVALLLIVALASSCLYQRASDAPAAARESPSPRYQVKRTVDRETGKVSAECGMLLYPDRAPVKHGTETTWYPSGAKEWERRFKNGEPVGTWKSWYEDGQARSEATFDAGVLGTMSFWHANGRLAAQGPARGGVRIGEWKFWHANGRLEEEGTYVENLRQGVWRAWSEDGLEEWEVRYANNQRISKTEIPRER